MKTPVKIRREKWEQICDELELPHNSDADLVLIEIKHMQNLESDEIKKLELEADDRENLIDEQRYKIAQLEKRIAEL